MDFTVEENPLCGGTPVYGGTPGSAVDLHRQFGAGRVGPGHRGFSVHPQLPAVSQVLNADRPFEGSAETQLAARGFPIAIRRARPTVSQCHRLLAATSAMLAASHFRARRTGSGNKCSCWRSINAVSRSALVMRVCDQPSQECDVVGHTDDVQFIEGRAHTPQASSRVSSQPSVWRSSNRNRSYPSPWPAGVHPHMARRGRRGEIPSD